MGILLFYDKKSPFIAHDTGKMSILAENLRK